MTIITNSDRANFRACERRHYLSSHLKLNLEPVSEKPYLTFGTLIHKALHMMYGYSENPVDAFLNAYTYHGSHLGEEYKELGVTMMGNYHHYALGPRPVQGGGG